MIFSTAALVTVLSLLSCVSAAPVDPGQANNTPSNNNQDNNKGNANANNGNTPAVNANHDHKFHCPSTDNETPPSLLIADGSNVWNDGTISCLYQGASAVVHCHYHEDGSIDAGSSDPGCKSSADH